VQLGRIAIYAKGTSPSELVVSVASAEQSDAEHARSPRRQKIPYSIADHVTFVDGYAESLLTIEKEVGRRLRAENIPALHHDRVLSDVEDLQRAIDLRSSSRSGNAMRHICAAQGAQKLHRAGKRSALRQELSKQLSMPPLQRLSLLRGDFTAELSRDRAGEESAAHSDAAVNAPTVDSETCLRQRTLPCEHVSVDGIDESSIEIENQGGHNCLHVSSYSSNMENQSPRLADLVTILYRPRETIRRILDAGRHRWSIEVVVLAFVCASVNDIDAQRLGEGLPDLKVLPLIAIVGLSIVIGAASWVIALFILSWIVTPIGRLLGGTGSTRDVRAALGWGMVPVAWSFIYRLPIVVLMSHYQIGPRQNPRELVVQFLSHGGCSIVVLFFALQSLFALWCIALGSFTVAEAQDFSTQKGFVNLAISLVLPLMVFFAAVFTFRH